LTNKPSREKWGKHIPFFSKFSYQVIIYGIYVMRLISYLPEWGSNLVMMLLLLGYRVVRWLNKWVN